MKKIQSLSFYQNSIKYITVDTNSNYWTLLNHGEIPLHEDNTVKTTVQWTKKKQELFKISRFKKNYGFITVESHHTYLNKKSINTLEKINHQEIIKNNFINTLPILFEKNRYGLDYDVALKEIMKTTEILFMGMLQENIDYLYQTSLSMGITPLVLNPSYQYFAAFLSKQVNKDLAKEYVLFAESSSNYLTLVLIHNNNPIMKKSIEISDSLERETTNYFYYLKNYLMLPSLMIYFSKIDDNMALLILKAVKPYFNTTPHKIIKTLRERPCFKEITDETLTDYQDCFIALGGMVADESI